MSYPEEEAPKPVDAQGPESAPATCSSDATHAAHTWGGRPMRYCPGVPEWRKCPQCQRENSVETWNRLGKCPNCGGLYEKEIGEHGEDKSAPPRRSLEGASQWKPEPYGDRGIVQITPTEEHINAASAGEPTEAGPLSTGAHAPSTPESEK